MKNAMIILAIVALSLQLIQVDKINHPIDKSQELQAPEPIKKILQNSCYDCHSNHTKWPWYSYIAPFSWSVAKNVKNARASLNFSTWQEYTQKERSKRLKEVYRTIFAPMPPRSYLFMHPEADLSKEQRTRVREWIRKQIEVF